MTKYPLIFAVVACLTSPAYSQVIEIGADGDATVYDAPTVFADEGNSPVFERAVSTKYHVQNPPYASASVAEVEREYGLPSGLVDAVIYQESRGRTNAVSVKGALGLMQLMPGTAAQLGVNPLDPEQNIRGGARYLRQQIDRFSGSIPLALAAYNAGPGAVTKYGGIPPYRETQDYVTKILSRWQPISSPTSPAIRGQTALAAPTVQYDAFLLEVTEP